MKQNDAHAKKRREELEKLHYEQRIDAAASIAGNVDGLARATAEMSGTMGFMQLFTSEGRDQVKEAFSTFVEATIVDMNEVLLKFALFDPLKSAWEGFLKSVLQSFETTIFEQSMGKEWGAKFGKQFADWIGGMFGGMFGGGITSTGPFGGIFARHSGGMAKQSGQYRLTKGEGVFTPQQMKHLAASQSRGSTKITVINNSSQQVSAEAQEEQDGTVSISLYDALDDMMAQTIAKPGNFQESVLGITGSRRPILSR